MNEATTALELAALALGVAERARLAELLLDSFNETDPIVDQLWLEESKTRMASFRAGTIKALTAEEFFRGMQNS